MSAKIPTTRCLGCGRISLSSPVRCRRCGATQFVNDQHDAVATVQGSTANEIASFAIAEFEPGLQALVIGLAEHRPAIGDRIVVHRAADGTYNLVSIEAGPA